MNTQADFRRDLSARERAVDRLLLGDYIRKAEICAFGEERDVEQTLRFNVMVELVPADAPVGDDVDGILSYDTLVQTIDTVLRDERLDLLETLAERIADRLLAIPAVRHLTLRVEKLDRGPFALGVEIERTARQAVAAVPDLFAIRGEAPLVVLVDEAALGDARLSERFDALLAPGRPVVLAPCSAPERGETGGVDRQIDLLAMEQAAWRIAGRDARCRVIESRTELQHAIDQTCLAVWAPSRIVRRATDPKVRDRLQGRALAEWFAERLGAGDVVELGPIGAAHRLDATGT